MNNIYSKKTITAIGSLAFMLPFLISCDSFSAEPQTVTFLNHSFSVTMPASWSLRDDLNDVADVQMGDLIKEAYAIIISENKMDFNNMSLQGHSDLTRALVRDSLQNYRESGPEHLDNGKFPALRYRLEGTIDDLNVVYWHVTLETANHYHQILMWSLKSKFAGNETDFNSLIRSFKEIAN